MSRNRSFRASKNEELIKHSILPEGLPRSATEAQTVRPKSSHGDDSPTEASITQPQQTQIRAIITNSDENGGAESKKEKRDVKGNVLFLCRCGYIGGLTHHRFWHQSTDDSLG